MLRLSAHRGTSPAEGLNYVRATVNHVDPTLAANQKLPVYRERKKGRTNYSVSNGEVYVYFLSYICFITSLTATNARTCTRLAKRRVLPTV